MSGGLISNNNVTMPFNTVTYNKNSEVAKELLNTKVLMTVVNGKTVYEG